MRVAGRQIGLGFRFGVAALALLVEIGGFCAATHAQAVGAALSGLVTDEKGGAVPNATVSIKNVGTGKSVRMGMVSIPRRTCFRVLMKCG